MDPAGTDGTSFVPSETNSWLRPCRPCQLVENFGPDLPGYCLKCVKCGRLILRKIIEIFATRSQIFELKCTKSHLGRGFAPDPTGGAYSAPPDPLAGFKGAYF